MSDTTQHVRLSILERREAVGELTEEGLSTREIGDVLGVNHDTVAEDRKKKASVGNPTDAAENPIDEASAKPPAVGNPTGAADQQSGESSDLPPVED